MTLTHELKQQARQLGFTLVGVCPAIEPTGINRFYQWLDRGYAGTMDYLPNRAHAYRHPDSVLPGVRSLLMLAMDYQTKSARPVELGQGHVSRYAWGHVDYHDLIHKRLKQLVAWLKERKPDNRARGVVDTAPLLEREFAQLAGLGWVGKHTLLINPQRGSWFFLAAVLTDLELDYDAPQVTDHCGRCTACLEACPTGAFPQPYVLDATRCISYLTIEHREQIPDELAADLGEWVFGCDVCQQVCPWNRKAPESQEPDFQPRRDLYNLDLHRLFELTDDAFRRLFRKTPLWRAKRRGLLRNAAIVLGNQRSRSALPTLRQGQRDDDPVVGAACRWAIQRIRDRSPDASGWPDPTTSDDVNRPGRDD